MGADSNRLVKLGFVAGVYGVRGWVKIHSFTDPRDSIAGYPRWVLDIDGQRHDVQLESGRAHGKTVIAKLAGIEDRDQAGALIGADIYVGRDELPACGPGEFYWADLEGLTVEDEQGGVLGRIDHMIATGAHDVMVLEGEGERLIPFVIDDVVIGVDLERGVVVVNWDASYWQE